MFRWGGYPGLIGPEKSKFLQRGQIRRKNRIAKGEILRPGREGANENQLIETAGQGKTKRPSNSLGCGGGGP